ncbi:MAG: glycerophosphoryl diester phosphodiesterase membrane domain-containing protein [Caldilineaceae bacterium]|nr:glycerophosphoryl diester phosphodiesterase membrane domain-containing protein [Caldilineaceae bacterium]
MQSPFFRANSRTIGDLLDWSVRLYRARFGKLILTAAIFLVPLGLLSGIISGQTMTSYAAVFMQAMQDPEILANREVFTDIQNDNPLLALSYLLMPLSMAATGIATLALTGQALAVLQQRELGIGASIRLGLRRFWAWVGMTFAMYAAYFGVAIVVMVIFFILFFFLIIVASGFVAFENAAQGSEPGTAGFIGMLVGILCLYIGAFFLILAPFAYLAARWAVALPALLEQSLGPLEALSESWKLTKGQVRRTLGYVVLLYLFYSVIYIAILTLSMAASSMLLDSYTFASVAIFGLLGALLPVLWQPLAVAAYTVLYYDLRMRNQGYDLELRVQQLEAEVARAAQPPL